MKTSRKTKGGELVQEMAANTTRKAKPESFRVFVSPYYLKGIKFTGCRSKKFKGRPFFKFRLMDYEANGLSNMAKCLGYTHKMLFNYFCHHFEDEMERMLGFDKLKAADLSASEVRIIRERIKALGHTFRVGDPRAKRN